jgi:branched-chain amino acid transport system ATP-binding protein
LSLLQVSNIHAHYGPIHAIRGVSFNVDAGRMVGIIGRNGAGKSTIMHALCGIHPPSGGSIAFDGERIDRLPAHEVVKRGIAYVPEGRRIFSDLSVKDNLELGAFIHVTGRSRTSVAADYDRVYGMFPILRDRAQQPGGTLSGGQQQMLAIGRALMSRPRLLLLDEPSMGLAPVVVNDLFAAISRLHKSGLTVVIVEQKAFKTLKMVDLAHVVVHGQLTMSGTGAELLASDEVKTSYLGRGGAAGAVAKVTPPSPGAPIPVALPAPDAPVEPALVDRTSRGVPGPSGPAPSEAESPTDPDLPQRGLVPGEQVMSRMRGSREQAWRELHRRTRA